MVLQEVILPKSNDWMKKSILLLGILCWIISSCGDDDGTDAPSYSFLDQDLQGIIDGQPFLIGVGTASESTFNEGEYSIKIYDQDEDVSNVCDFFGFGNEVSILFDIPAIVGVYPLSHKSGKSDCYTYSIQLRLINIIVSDRCSRNTYNNR